MNEPLSLFDEAIEALTFARQATLSEAANIPDERWDFRPDPNAKSVDELVRHIIQATAMLVGEAADREGDFRRRSPAEHVRAHAEELPEGMSPAELRDVLEREAGEAHMSTGITRFDGGTWSRVTYVFYAASHESYHCGQLATYARSMGLVPALTQRIHGDDAK
jgi:uncharacterized damage-inducible protein DinB